MGWFRRQTAEEKKAHAQQKLRDLFFKHAAPFAPVILNALRESSVRVRANAVQTAPRGTFSFAELADKATDNILYDNNRKLFFGNEIVYSIGSQIRRVPGLSIKINQWASHLNDQEFAEAEREGIVKCLEQERMIYRPNDAPSPS